MPNIEELDKLMADDVFANGNAISCKAGEGKVIAAFPDVCLSPPSPPAGPIPVPYPNTSFSKDMKNGSKTVKIGGKEVMLKDKSFYKTSPLGDEAATRSFGANVLTHVITGKTYFGAWSMDVKFEGENVPRHIDLTTSNHASYPGGSGPMTNAEKSALKRIAENKCPCCRKPDHGTTGKAMNMEEWYIAENPGKEEEVIQLLAKARARPGCHCPKDNTRILPTPPCDVFYEKHPIGQARKDQKKQIHDSWNECRSAYKTRHGFPSGLAIKELAIQQFKEENGREPYRREMDEAKKSVRKTNHLTPKSAGGCPDNPRNLQPHFKLCAACRKIDAEFNKFQ